MLHEAYFGRFGEFDETKTIIQPCRVGRRCDPDFTVKEKNTADIETKDIAEILAECI